MVRPHDKANKTNGNHGVCHTEIAKDRFFRERCDDVRHNTKGRQNHNIHFWVTKEPKQMLIQNGITTALSREEVCTEVTVSQ